ncbi:MAG: flagellar assembly protein FliW [Dissulfurispiraceae bacterium]|jgi:flagellar assembly factor FliW|nr:flagellar assembly protein FliW [Dissulfurispiraceae bacterium]
MKIETSRFGELDISEDKILEFLTGIPGFSNLKKFTVLEYKDPVSWLQSMENPELAFIISNPFNLFSNYSIKLGDDVLKFLDIQDDSEVLIFVLLSVSDNILTANLRAPLIINTRTRKATQLIVDDERLPFKTPVSTAVK